MVSHLCPAAALPVDIAEPVGFDEMNAGRRRAVVIWHSIGNYHHCRNLAANRLSGLDLEVLELSKIPDYAEFASGVPSLKSYRVRVLDLDRTTSSKELRRRMRAALHSQKPDVVFVPGWSPSASLMAVEWCAGNNVACVLMSDSTIADKVRFPGKETIKRRVVALTQAGFVAGAPQATYLRRLGMRESQIATGYDVVDNVHFWVGSQAARKSPIPERRLRKLPDRYFLSCSRFVEVKNIARLIDAFQAYRMKTASSGKPPWDLVLVGDGKLRSEIERDLSSRRLDGCVRLTGYQSYEELPVYYGLANAFVLASVSEPWGLVVNEAMAAGLPVLVSDRCGCAADLVKPGRNGFTFDPYDTDQLSTLMARMASDECDRAAMSVASREIIAQWDLKQFALGLRRAAFMALAAPRKRASLLDRALLRFLSAR